MSFPKRRSYYQADRFHPDGYPQENELPRLETASQCLEPRDLLRFFCHTSVDPPNRLPDAHARTGRKGHRH